MGLYCPQGPGRLGNPCVRWERGHCGLLLCHPEHVPGPQLGLWTGERCAEPRGRGGAGVFLPVSITLKVKVSLKAGFRVLRCTLVSYFFFLSGSRKTLTYGSEVPPMSRAGSSAACRTPTVSCGERESGSRDSSSPRWVSCRPPRQRPPQQESGK